MTPDQKNDARKLSEELLGVALSRTADNGIAIPAILAILAWYLAKDMVVTGQMKNIYLRMVASYFDDHLDDYKEQLEAHRDAHPTVQ